MPPQRADSPKTGYRHHYIKKLTRHGTDAVLYIPRPLQHLGWRDGSYIELRSDHDAKEITITKLTAGPTKGAILPGPYGRDRRATRAPEN